MSRSLTPGQTFIKIIHEELVQAIGGESVGLNLRVQPPLVVLLAGLQGAGKTTTAGKLARWLQSQNRKRVLLASADVHRPAAILQLERLAQRGYGEDYFGISLGGERWVFSEGHPVVPGACEWDHDESN